MGSTLLRNIVIALALIIFSFVVGIVAADSAQEAAVWLFAVIGILVFIAAGKKIWMGIFLVTPFCDFMPSVVRIPSVLLLIVAIFSYWIILAMLGYVKFEWKKPFALDIFVFLFVAYMGFSFCRNPVAISGAAVLGADMDHVGGREYLHTVLAFVVYLAISAIPFSKESMPKILRLKLFFMVFVVLSICIKGLIMSADGGDPGGTVADAFQNTRFSHFADLGIVIAMIVYGTVPLKNLMLSFWRLSLLALSFCFILISGWRTYFVVYGASILGCSIIKREIILSCLLAFVTYFGIWYLSEMDYVKRMPYGVQRVLTMCPGIEVESSIKHNAEGSSEWRIKMWKWTLDPRTGYIRDYVYGDGPGRSFSSTMRANRAVLRGEARNNQDLFTVQKEWHNGYLTNLSMIGIVGSVIMLALQLYCVFMALYLCRALMGSEYYLYAIVHMVPLFSGVFFYYISKGTILGFVGNFASIAYIKVFYDIARKEGRLSPLRRYKFYVPIMVREREKSV